jgi:hypothetical protein
LADAIADPHNPLTARVIVNRVWGQVFGRPLVGTPSNFGTLGDPPTHPELLDDLAVRFMANGWSLKWLVRELALSATYRQSVAPPAVKATADPRYPEAIDPENKLLGRMNRRRLSVEQWRDALLAAAGRLDPAVGGKSIDPQDPKDGRRTVYAAVSRLDLNRLLAVFDFPDPNAHADRRTETTTPLQKLYALNGAFVAAQAAALADRLLADGAGDDEAADRGRIDLAYRLLYARPPADAEVRLGLAFLAADGDRPAAWRHYAHALIVANETMFLD